MGTHALGNTPIETHLVVLQKRKRKKKTQTWKRKEIKEQKGPGPGDLMPPSDLQVYLYACGRHTATGTDTHKINPPKGKTIICPKGLKKYRTYF